ncbi:AAA family ATPase [Streptosporangium sandarakinum]|uniref:AAA family ATPase n=1 Tax=Streptosporangium sandarakinum TaxID=1260955 RepID=UPI003D92FCD0
MALPTLTVVSGPPGSGKTTLAHRLARELGHPAIIRDEIKQGMADAAGDRGPDAGAALNLPVLKVFFDVLGLLTRAGVSVVAEAAFQDRVWRPNLQPLIGLARIRVIRCVVDAALAGERIARRAASDAHRAAHADHDLLKAIAAGERDLAAFGWISMDLPALTVDTTGGYDPPLPDIVAFAAARAAPREPGSPT